MLKALGAEGLSWMTHLFNTVQKSGTVPKEWQTGVVVPLFSYRGITLLSLPGKIYSEVLERRVWPLDKLWIEGEQCGFRPGCGITDQLLTLARI